MTQEDKELLLKDLCARLPYEVKGRVYAETTNGEYDINGDMIFFDSPFDVILDEINTSTEEIHVIAVGNEDTIDFIEDQQIDGSPFTIGDFKPYLRPMSSMTEEEKKIICSMNMLSDIELSDRLNYQKMYVQNYTIETFDLFNAHYLDYRGLIPMGLALKAKEGMYNINN